MILNKTCQEKIHSCNVGQLTAERLNTVSVFFKTKNCSDTKENCQNIMLCMVVYTCNPSTEATETEES
jgi:hypothetical protein